MLSQIERRDSIAAIIATCCSFVKYGTFRAEISRELILWTPLVDFAFVVVIVEYIVVAVVVDFVVSALLKPYLSSATLNTAISFPLPTELIV